MNGKNTSLRIKVILMISVFMLTTNLALGYILTKQARDATKTQLNDRMLDIVNTAAAMLDGDVLKRLTAEDRGSEEYQAVYDMLARFRDNISLDYIYYVRPEGDKKFTFGIDPDPVAPGRFGSPVVYTDALYAASQGTASVDEKPYEDAWGRFYSAFSPVFDSEGNVAAVVTADFGTDWYDAQLDQSTRTIVIACTLFLLIGIILVIIMTGQYSRQMEAIRASLRDLAEDLEGLTREFSENGEEKSVPSDPEDGSIQALGNRISDLRDKLREYVTHEQTQANSMITAMASDYRCVYYVNLDENDGVCCRDDPSDPDQTPVGVHFPYLERISWYAENCVTEKYRDGFREFVEPDNIRARLASERIIAYRYLAARNGHEYYEMIRVAGVRRAEDRDDHIVHAVGLGLTEIDQEMRETMANNEALAEALVQAEEANKAKTAFLSNMSHEIRTPMNAIIGLDSIALHDPDISPHTREELEKIGASAKHLLALINDILDMSRIESGRMELKENTFSLREFLEQINIIVDGQCEEKGLIYECNVIGTPGAYFAGDELKLKQVLINILGNSVKFTDPPGSVRFSVEQTQTGDGRCSLRFTVTDTGIGMDEAFIDKLFDAFSQEDATTTNKYGGSGLGMAISRRMIDMMGGDILVRSEKGVGSAFTVTVPLQQASMPDAPDKAGEEAEDTGACAPVAGLHVLVAEDQEMNAEILGDLLEMEEVSYEWAENGQIAVELFSQSGEKHFDAVLMDMRMPVMDGLDATRAIRRLERPDAKEVPIIALTANAFEEDVQRCLEAGMDAHLSKPVDIDALKLTLGRLIYGKGRGGTIQETKYGVLKDADSSGI